MRDPKGRIVIKRACRETGQIPATEEKLGKSDYSCYISRRAKPPSKISRLYLSRCVALLKASCQRLKSDSTWTKGALARSIDKKATCITSRAAVSFCIDGALKRTQHDLKLSNRHVATCREL